VIGIYNDWNFFVREVHTNEQFL